MVAKTKMRILHLPINTASVPNNSVKALQNSAMYTRGIMFDWDKHFYHEDDVMLSFPGEKFKNLKLELIFNLPMKIIYFPYLFKFNIFHYHTSSYFPRSWERFFSNFQKRGQ